MNLSFVEEYLPPIIKEMIDVMGLELTEKLVENFGGTTFSFSSENVYYQRLKEKLGENNAARFYHYFQCEKIYIPQCKRALQELKKFRFYRDFCYLTDTEGKSARIAMIELCPKYKISDRYGWKIISSMRHHSSQGDLFVR